MAQDYIRPRGLTCYPSACQQDTFNLSRCCHESPSQPRSFGHYISGISPGLLEPHTAINFGSFSFINRPILATSYLSSKYRLKILKYDFLANIQELHTLLLLKDVQTFKSNKFLTSYLTPIFQVISFFVCLSYHRHVLYSDTCIDNICLINKLKVYALVLVV